MLAAPVLAPHHPELIIWPWHVACVMRLFTVQRGVLELALGDKSCCKSKSCSIGIFHARYIPQGIFLMFPSCRVIQCELQLLMSYWLLGIGVCLIHGLPSMVGHVRLHKWSVQLGES